MSDIRSEALLDRTKHYYGNVHARMQTISALALFGLKTGAVLNGGALLALGALLGHAHTLTIHVRFMRSAATWFAGGLSAVLLTALVGYAAQNMMMQAELVLAEALHSQITGVPTTMTAMSSMRTANLVLLAAVLLAAVVIIAFVRGSWWALYCIDLPAPR